MVNTMNAQKSHAAELLKFYPLDRNQRNRLIQGFFNTHPNANIIGNKNSKNAFMRFTVNPEQYFRYVVRVLPSMVNGASNLMYMSRTRKRMNSPNRESSSRRR